MLDFDVHEYFLEQDEDDAYDDMNKLKKLFTMFNGLDNKQDQQEMYENIIQFIGYCVMCPVLTNIALISDNMSKNDIKKLDSGDILRVKSDYSFAQLSKDGTDSSYIPVFTSKEENIFLTNNNVYNAKIDIGMLLDYVRNQDGFDGIVINPNSDAFEIDLETIDYILNVATIANNES